MKKRVVNLSQFTPDNKSRTKFDIPRTVAKNIKLNNHLKSRQNIVCKNRFTDPLQRKSKHRRKDLKEGKV